jgi:type IV pilus assembly protein PilB
LRQDPDVILVGEVRDLETAEIAFQAAQTGHLVLTTLHTNDAPSTVVRLLDLGLESYVIASSLGGVLAQRLVRKLCTTCSRDLVPEEIEQIKKQYGFEATGFKEASGCVDCDHTGYHGRVGVYSLLTINQKIREIIRKGGNEDDIAAEGRKNGMKDLFVAGMELVKQGVSSLSEVARVIGVTQTSMSTQAMQASAIESKQTSSLDVSGGEIDDELSVAALASTQNQGQIKVLLVDDDEGVRMIMSRRLKKEGFEVVDAFDGQDGIEKLQSFTPDVIICDLMMPRVDGHEFVKHVRANSKIAKLPVIMLTNSDNEQNELMMIEAGANDFVSKTASIKIVVARIKRMLGKA